MNRSMLQMSLGDFSSVVQLGVGLHAGTAILQSIAEFAGTPLTRRVERLRLLAEVKTKRDAKYKKCFDDACDLLGDLEVKKVQFFNEYKQVVQVNAGVAIALCFLLAVIAFDARGEAPIWAGLFIVALSFAPAGVSLVVLGQRWMENTAGLSEKIIDLENCLLGFGN
jgi:hypothetical protein